MKTIYVSIPCLEDQEIFNTLDDLYQNADYPERVVVSVAFFLKALENDIISQIKALIPNKAIANFYNHSEFMGVGAGRRMAYKNYNNEDYFLQIDSHTMLNRSWDTRLISYLSEAQHIYGKGSVLTAYLSGYQYSLSGEKQYINRNKPMYPLFISSWSQLDGNYGSGQWKLMHKNMAHSIVSEGFYIDDTKKYELCNKFNANFIFSDSNFAKNYEKFFPFNFLFFEEELIMSIEMFDSGYIPVYPNFDIGMAHLYIQNIDQRNSRNIINPTKEDIAKSDKNIGQYLDINMKKVLSFYNYANIDKKTNLCKKDFSIPTTNRKIKL